MNCLGTVLKFNKLKPAATLMSVLTVVFLFTSAAVAQEQKKSTTSQTLERKLDEQQQQEPEDVVRVRTDLVQTSVSVFDKRGKFVDNLRADDFELRVDNSPSSVLFFERVVNGATVESTNENRSNRSSPREFTPADATRTVVFFIDDVHLSSESISRTRKMLTNYVDNDMGEDDQVLITSSSGQIGFLQQLTSDKDVLHAAIERIRYKPQTLFDSEHPRMSVFQALAVERGDEEVSTYFEDVLLRDQLAAVYRNNPSLARDTAQKMTKARADRIIHSSDSVVTQTLAALRSAVLSTSGLRGRKLVIFVSDGFLVNNQHPDIRDRLQRITDAAVKSGAVMYTIQAGGLTTDFPDASSDAMLIAGTGTGRILGEDIAVQDPLTELAADTGGKALLNANELNPGVRRALAESNDYYLLAWRPEPGRDNKNFHHVDVSVKNHSKYSVQVQHGFFSNEPFAQPAAATTAKSEKEKPKLVNGFPMDEMIAAIRGKIERGPLQTNLLVNYTDVPLKGGQLSVLMQADRPAQNGAMTSGPIDVAGVVYDDSGKVVGSFVEALKPEVASATQGKHLTYLNQFDVKPGLYQVRVAARDTDGVSAMSMQWITVPDLNTHQLALSSLLLGERDSAGNDAQAEKAQLKVDKRFLRNSRLRVLAYIYNASNDTSGQPARLTARIDIFSGNRAVVSTPTFAVDRSNAPDQTRIPYAGELNLSNLSKGRYRLRLTVIDLHTKSFATQQTNFEIN
jgi:VWFA-related protein